MYMYVYVHRTRRADGQKACWILSFNLACFGVLGLAPHAHSPGNSKIATVPCSRAGRPSGPQRCPEISYADLQA